ncbi:hypothetical protein HDU99_008101 [Rhizoclosmatium hyalinum]|nr:hypothetical protein HDU99_008101 [Rhizoclosmatium hyalinum]
MFEVSLDTYVRALEHVERLATDLFEAYQANDRLQYEIHGLKALVAAQAKELQEKTLDLASCLPRDSRDSAEELETDESGGEYYCLAEGCLDAVIPFKSTTLLAEHHAKAHAIPQQLELTPSAEALVPEKTASSASSRPLRPKPKKKLPNQLLTPKSTPSTTSSSSIPTTTASTPSTRPPLSTKKPMAPTPTTTPQTPRSCLNCSATETPMWRNGPYEHTWCCNRCGIKWKRGHLKEWPRWAPSRTATATRIMNLNAHKRSISKSKNDSVAVMVSPEPRRDTFDPILHESNTEEGDEDEQQMDDGKAVPPSPTLSPSLVPTLSAAPSIISLSGILPSSICDTPIDA